MEIKKLAKFTDQKTLEPKVKMEVIFTMEDLHRPPQQLGSMVISQYNNYVQPRPAGIQIIPVNTPCIKVTYTVVDKEKFIKKYKLTNFDEKMADIALDNITRQFGLSLNNFSTELETIYGKDADVFMYTISTQKYTNPDTLEPELGYLVRCSAVTKEMREEAGLGEYVTGGIYD
jgi:hypothetical protein